MMKPKVKGKGPLKRGKLTGKRLDRGFRQRRKVCRFCADKNRTIDYKDAKFLESFIKERGKIVSSRYSGNCALHQRLVAEEIRKARFISLLPYSRA
ncbi:MAG: 30S ribosomal protein S18 [Candidatus Omnitrophica bacterium]|nr:30S ribosomal protein S18 [Candidatus Omnitrophota bacterium]